jgi:hypothetical protein
VLDSRITEAWLIINNVLWFGPLDDIFVLWYAVQWCTMGPVWSNILILINFEFHEIFWFHVQQALRCAVFGSRKNPCRSKPRFVRLHLCNKIFIFSKKRVSARLLAKIRVSQGYCYVVQCTLYSVSQVKEGSRMEGTLDFDSFDIGANF